MEAIIVKTRGKADAHPKKVKVRAVKSQSRNAEKKHLVGKIAGIATVIAAVVYFTWKFVDGFAFFVWANTPITSESLNWDYTTTALFMSLKELFIDSWCGALTVICAIVLVFLTNYLIKGLKMSDEEFNREK